MSRNKHRRHPRSPSRREPERKPYDRVLIVCEGEKTEPNYFTELRDYYRLSSANVVAIAASGSDPSSVVASAKRLSREAKREGDAYDQVFCVFDCDEHPHFQAASEQARALKLKTARSWPCFEYWLLLHYGYTRRPYHRIASRTAAKACEAALKKQLSAYCKGSNEIFLTLLPKLEDAKRHARKALQDAHATGEPNPSTEVHLLVEYLQHIKNAP